MRIWKEGGMNYSLFKTIRQASPTLVTSVHLNLNPQCLLKPRSLTRSIPDLRLPELPPCEFRTWVDKHLCSTKSFAEVAATSELAAVKISTIPDINIKAALVRSYPCLFLTSHRPTSPES